MTRQEKIALIKKLLSGEDLSPAKAYYFEGEAPEGFRPGKDYLICFNELEPLAKTLKPFMAIGVSKQEYGDAFISIVNDDCARSLVTWINTDELPQPAQSETSFRRQNDMPPMEVRSDVKIETSSLRKDDMPPTPQPTPPPEPEFMPVTYRPKSAFRNNRI